MSDAAAPRIDPPVRGVGPLLRLAVIVAFAAAGVGTLTTGSVSRMAGGVAVATVVAAPLLRVAILTGTWWHRHDRRYALVGLALLAVVGLGAVVALIS